MSSWEGRKFFKKRASAIFNSFRILMVEKSVKALICAGIQVAGGIALAAYAYENSTCRILPIVCSAIAIGGIYNMFKTIRKNTSSAFIETDIIQSTWELASGAIAYSAGIYAFSESLKRDNKIWIPCLALAASGYYCCVSAIDDVVTAFNRSLSLTFYQLMFEPALIACASAFLLYFRSHEESYLYWLPFALIGAIGYRIACEGFGKAECGDRELLRLKIFKTLMGGSLLTFSTIALTVHGLIHNFPLIWTVSMMTATFFGAFIVYVSLTCLRRYIGVDKKVFYPAVGLAAGPLILLSTCLTILFVEDATMVYFIFLFLAGSGHFILCGSLYQLYKVIYAPSLKKQFLCVMGLKMTVFSSLATACIAYRMNWWFCLVTAPFIPAGLYASYRGYKRD